MGFSLRGFGHCCLWFVRSLVLSMNIQLFQHHLLAVFPPLNCFCTFVKKSIGHIYFHLFLSSLLCSIDLYVCPSGLDYYSHVMSWKLVNWFFPRYSSFSKLFSYSRQRSSLVAQMVKNLPSMKETWVQSLGWGRSPGEGYGNPLQYSCLENLMDRGAWWDTVHGFAKRQTRLSDWHTVPLPFHLNLEWSCLYLPKTSCRDLDRNYIQLVSIGVKGYWFFQSMNTVCFSICDYF